MSAINTKVTVEATSTLVLNSSFRTCILTNYWTTWVIWLKIGQTWDAVVGEGIPLIPASLSGWIGGSFAINDDKLFQSPITAISSSGDNLLAMYYI